ncbi:MAG: asparagine synthase C-terminal domain-containing protein [Promethearchaeota archaeon]
MIDFASNTRKLKTLLGKAITQQLDSVERSGLLFSGGLDSSILLALLSTLNTTPIPLLVAGITSSKDIKAATSAAAALGLQIEVQHFTLDDVERALPTIITASESTDVLQVSLAIPLHFSAIHARKLGVTTLVSGQGADELFGGYARYERLILKEERQSVLAEMIEDLKTLMQVTLPCQKSLVQYHGIQLVTPFLSPGIVAFSKSLPLHHKIITTDSRVVRKRILRKLAKDLRLPGFIVNAPKRALQYGSGSSRILARLSTRFWQQREPTIPRREARSHANIHRFLCLVKEGLG